MVQFSASIVGEDLGWWNSNWKYIAVMAWKKARNDRQKQITRYCWTNSNMAGYLIVLFIVAFLQCAVAFTASRSPIRTSRFSLNMVQKEAFQLVLLRHGESSWNKENKFTGWYDCPLSEKGHAEAAAAGALLKEEGERMLPDPHLKGYRRVI